MPTLAGIFFGDEKALLRYDRNRYSQSQLDRYATMQPKSVRPLLTSLRYYVVGGVWGASMLGSLGILVPIARVALIFCCVFITSALPVATQPQIQPKVDSCAHAGAGDASLR